MCAQWYFLKLSLNTMLCENVAWVAPHIKQLSVLPVTVTRRHFILSVHQLAEHSPLRVQVCFWSGAGPIGETRQNLRIKITVVQFFVLYCVLRSPPNLHPSFGTSEEWHPHTADTICRDACAFVCICAFASWIKQIGNRTGNCFEWESRPSLRSAKITFCWRLLSYNHPVGIDSNVDQIIYCRTDSNRGEEDLNGPVYAFGATITFSVPDYPDFYCTHLSTS